MEPLKNTETERLTAEGSYLLLASDVLYGLISRDERE